MVRLINWMISVFSIVFCRIIHPISRYIFQFSLKMYDSIALNSVHRTNKQTNIHVHQFHLLFFHTKYTQIFMMMMTSFNWNYLTVCSERNSFLYFGLCVRATRYMCETKVQTKQSTEKRIEDENENEEDGKIGFIDEIYETWATIVLCVCVCVGCTFVAHFLFSIVVDSVEVSCSHIPMLYHCFRWNGRWMNWLIRRRDKQTNKKTNIKWKNT